MAFISEQFRLSEYSDGQTPFINQNGYWQIGSTETTVKASGVDGVSFDGVVEYYAATLTTNVTTLDDDSITPTPPVFNKDAIDTSIWKTDVKSTKFGQKDSSGVDYKYLWNVEGIKSKDAEDNIKVDYLLDASENILVDLYMTYSGGRVPEDYVSYYATSTSNMAPEKQPTLNLDGNAINLPTGSTWQDSSTYSGSADADIYLFEISFVKYAEKDENGKNLYAKISGPTLIGHNGSNGGNLEVQYQNATSSSELDANGWKPNMPSVETGKKTFMRQKLSTSDTWSNPIQISAEDGDTPTIEIVTVNGIKYWKINGETTSIKAEGQDGDTPTVEIKDGVWVINNSPTGVNATGPAGKDGTDIEYVYYRSKAEKPTLSAPGVSDIKPYPNVITESTGNTWYPSPVGITETWKYEYMSVRTKPAGNDTKWTNFSAPVIWSKWGDKGMDGDGVEYKYYLSDTEEDPSYGNGQGWTDEPSGVTASKRFEYVAIITTKHDETGKAVTTVAVTLWNKYVVDGEVFSLSVEPRQINSEVGGTINVKLYHKIGTEKRKLYEKPYQVTFSLNGISETYNINNQEGTIYIDDVEYDVDAKYKDGATYEVLAKKTGIVQIVAFTLSGNHPEYKVGYQAAEDSVPILVDGQAIYQLFSAKPYRDEDDNTFEPPNEYDYTKFDDAPNDTNLEGKWFKDEFPGAKYYVQKVASPSEQANTPWGSVYALQNALTSREALIEALEEEEDDGIYPYTVKVDGVDKTRIGIKADAIRTGAICVGPKPTFKTNGDLDKLNGNIFYAVMPSKSKWDSVKQQWVEDPESGENDYKNVYIGGWTVGSQTGYNSGFFKDVEIEGTKYRYGMKVEEGSDEYFAWYVKKFTGSEIGSVPAGKTVFGVRFNGGIVATKGEIAKWNIGDRALSSVYTDKLSKEFSTVFSCPTYLDDGVGTSLNKLDSSLTGSESDVLVVKTKDSKGVWQYPFYIRASGYMRCSNLHATGGTIGGLQITSNTLQSSSGELQIQQNFVKFGDLSIEVEDGQAQLKCPRFRIGDSTGYLKMEPEADNTQGYQLTISSDGWDWDRIKLTIKTSAGVKLQRSGSQRIYWCKYTPGMANYEYTSGSFTIRYTAGAGIDTTYELLDSSLHTDWFLTDYLGFSTASASNAKAYAQAQKINCDDSWSDTRLNDQPWGGTKVAIILKVSNSKIISDAHFIPEYRDYKAIFNLGSSERKWNVVYAQVCKIDDCKSDIRIKNSIELLPMQYEKFFDKMEPSRYKYNDGTSNRYHTGFIAQQLVAALEESGLTTQDFAGVMLDNPGQENECWYLRRDEFVALNTWQIQKLKPRISTLEQTILNYETRISNLEAEIQNLKSV